jgi:hypothetical protein
MESLERLSACPAAGRSRDDRIFEVDRFIFLANFFRGDREGRFVIFLRKRLAFSAILQSTNILVKSKMCGPWNADRPLRLAMLLLSEQKTIGINCGQDKLPGFRVAMSADPASPCGFQSLRIRWSSILADIEVLILI